MAKNDKEAVAKKSSGPKESGAKEVAVKKGAEPAAPAARLLSPLRAWEREIERLFEDFPFGHWPRFRDLEPFRLTRELRLQAPTLDMYEEKNDVVVKAEMPGMTKDDIDITLTDSTLTLKGEKKKEEEVKEKDYYRCEREYGSFLRTVALPAEVKADGAKATFKEGVLEIRLPKTEAAKKKEVRLQVK
jgi:HSP20 family protein